MGQSVLILGSQGKIGSHSAEAFRNAGWNVKLYQRGTNMTEAAEGTDVIINGLNPPAYHDWANQIPAITNQVIRAAKGSGATVIVPGNIYNFGAQSGILDETTPQTANTRKGRVRVAMEQNYMSSGVRTIVLRAGNFIDPNGNGDYMSLLAMRNIAKDRLIAAGDPDAKQAYAYVPDWARAAQSLAEQREKFTGFEDVPFPGHTFSTNELIAKVRAETGRFIRLNHFPWFLMTLCSPFWELAYEMREMRYLYSMSHEIGNAKFQKLLPDFKPTPLDEVMLCGLRQGRDSS